MIGEERLTAYVNSLARENPAYLSELEAYARQTHVPVIRKQMQSLLRVLLTLTRPRKILEVGAAIGFSALLMSEYAPEGCHITTIEKQEERIALAREKIRAAGREDRITLLEGDAGEILPRLSGGYDFLFMDAAKGQYLGFLPDTLRLLESGGVLVSDNVLQDGEILESRFAVTRRNRTIHARMREYLYELTHRDDLETVVLTLGDGAAVSVKK